MTIAFCHHLSFSYNGGGEQEVGEIAKALQDRGHRVGIYALPLTLSARRASAQKPRPVEVDVPYKEAWFHKVDADVAYVTYHPFSSVNFRARCPRVGGFHSQVWFQRPSLSYGTIPFLAKMAYDLVGRPELGAYDAIHVHDDYLKEVLEFTGRPIYVIPHPIDPRVFRRASRKGGRSQFFFAGDRFGPKGLTSSWSSLPSFRVQE